jgi:hypothetical protein
VKLAGELGQEIAYRGRRIKGGPEEKEGSMRRIAILSLGLALFGALATPNVSFRVGR